MQAKRGRGRPSGPSVDPQTRREQLLDAAERAIARHGTNVGLAAVAHEMGVTRTAVYAVFPNRAALLAELASRHSALIMTTVVERAMTVEDGRGLIAAFLDALCEWVETHADLYRVIRGHSFLGGDAEHGLFDEVTNVVELQLTVAMQAKGAAAEAAAPLSRAMVGATVAAVEWWLGSGTMSRAELVGYLTDLGWGGGMSLPIEYLRPLSSEETTAAEGD